MNQEPEHISVILERVLQKYGIPEKIDMLLSQSANQEKDHLTIQETSQFINRSVPTIYSLVSKRQIPFYKCGKRLYFSKKELENWILNQKNRYKSNSEIEADACTRLVTEN